MRCSLRLFLFLPALACLRLGGSFPASAGSDDWLAVDPADLALKASTVEKDADAEALFWEVYLDDLKGALELSHYVRIKIFTNRGSETQSKVNIPYPGNFEVKDISARTIKPDGSITELKAGDVVERTIVSVSGARVKAKSFVLPSAEPGSIIEYRWREIQPGRFAQYLRLPFQSDIPIRRISYHIRPRAYVVGAMRFRYFHMAPTGLVPEGDGFYSSTRNNVPALREEPRSPPADQIRSWLLVYYVREQPLDVEKFWKDFGKSAYEIAKRDTKVDDTVRAAAIEAIGDASSLDEKLQRLFAYCRIRVKNIYSVASGITAEDRAKRKENKIPSDTLKHGLGSGGEIDVLFAALASAAGFESSLTWLPDRSDIFFDHSFPDGYFMNGFAAAVKIGDRWRFFDPGSPYVDYGMLPWWHEGEDALLPEPDGALFIKTLMSAPEKSTLRRTATLRLNEQGTLEGVARAEYSGHLGSEKKRGNEEDSPQQREQNLRDEIKSRMSSADLSDIKVENVTDPLKPFVYVYHISVPGYAQATGRRLFLEPAFFEHGIRPLFSSEQRKHEIYFHYPWLEEDEITIELPPGYLPENLDAPVSFALNADSGYKARIEVTQDGRAIVYKRSFFFGKGGTVLYPASSYPQIRNYFDAVQKHDSHAIVLMKGASS